MKMRLRPKSPRSMHRMTAVTPLIYQMTMLHTAKTSFASSKAIKSVLDGHLDHVAAATHRVELDPPETRLIHTASYPAGTKAKDFEKNEIDNILSLNVVEPFQTEPASPVVFALKKDKALQYCVEYRKHNAVDVQVSYRLPRMDE